MLRKLLYTAINCIGYYVVDKIFLGGKKIVQKDYKKYRKIRYNKK